MNVFEDILQGESLPPVEPLEPGICHHCGEITEIPLGVLVACTQHEEQSQVLTVRHLFALLGQIRPSKDLNPDTVGFWNLTLQRMRELQAHLLPPDQVATPDPITH